MSKHTPGPWELHETSSGGAIVSRGQVQSLQVVPVADARLIAAAPDLLESSADLLGWIERQLVPTYSDRKPIPENLEAAILKTKAAIAKAEGRDA